MRSESVLMRRGNKGLTVKVNLFPTHLSGNTYDARRYIKGQVVNADTNKKRMFNDAGELLTILGEWNVEKFKELRKAKAEAADSR
jgi:hypothetical protein